MSRIRFPHSVGEKTFLLELHNKIKNLSNDPTDSSTDEHTVLSRVKIISGMGGVGKTETVRQFIPEVKQYFANIIWIQSDSKGAMRDSFISLATRELGGMTNYLTNRGKLLVPFAILIQKIYEKLCSGQTLLIFDNADGTGKKSGKNPLTNLQGFFPDTLPPHLTLPIILVTSRCQYWELDTAILNPVEVIPLDLFKPDESESFLSGQLALKNVFPQLTFDPDTSKINGGETKGCIQKLAKILGHLPLSLQQAVAFIRAQLKSILFKNSTKIEIAISGEEMRIGWEIQINDYIEKYKKVEEKRKTLLDTQPFDSEAQMTVYTTWNVTFEKLSEMTHQGGQLALSVIQIMAFLHAENVPTNFLFCLLAPSSERDVSESLLLLETYAMIKCAPMDLYNYPSVNIHRQVQEVIVETIREGQYGNEEIRRILQGIMRPSREFLKNSNHFVTENYRAVLQSLWNITKKFVLMAPPVASEFLLFEQFVGNSLSEVGECKRALKSFRKLCDKWTELGTVVGGDEKINDFEKSETEIMAGEGEEEKELPRRFAPKGPKSVQMQLHLRWDIARTLQNQGNYKDSLKTYEDIYRIQKDGLGEQSPAALDTKFQIGVTYINMGKFEQALQVLESTLEGQEMVAGSDAEETWSTRLNIAVVYHHQGKYEKALGFYENIYEGQKRILGERDPEIIGTLHNKALILHELGKSEEALSLLKEACEMTKRFHGPEHVKTIRTELNMASILMSIGKLDEAQSVFEQCLKKQVDRFGEENVHTISTRANLAALWFERRDFGQAMDKFKEVYQSYCNVLGPSHPDTLRAQHNLASALLFQDQNKESLELCEEAYKGRSEVLGPSHPDTLKTKMILSQIALRMGDLTLATSHCQTASEILNKQFPFDDETTFYHPDILGSQEQVGLLFQALENYAEAIKILERVYECAVMTLGPEHVTTIGYLHNLASTKNLQGDYEGAMTLLEKVVKLYEKCLGPEHPNTIKSKHNLALTLGHQGHHRNALEAMESVLQLQYKMADPTGKNVEILGTKLNMAGLMDNLGRHDDALKLYKEVLEDQTKLLDPLHPDILMTKHNMASATLNMGQEDEAIELLQNSLQDHQVVYGMDHPKTISVQDELHNLLQFYFNHDSDAESGDDDSGDPDLLDLESLTKAFELIKESCGPEHSNTLAIQLALGFSYNQNGMYEDALEHLTRVHTIRSRNLGCHDPATLNAWEMILDVFQNQGKCLDAIPIYREIIGIKEESLGPSHLETLVTKHNFASCLKQNGELEEAENLILNVLQGRCKELGEENEDTWRTKENLGMIRKKQERLEEAFELMTSVVGFKEKKFGRENLHTVSSLHNLVTIMRCQGKLEEGLELARQVLKIEIEMLKNENHPLVLSAKFNLATILLGRVQSGGDDERLDGIRFLKEVCEGRGKMLGVEHPKTKKAKEFYDRQN